MLLTSFEQPFLAGVFAATLAWVGIRYITHILPSKAVTTPPLSAFAKT